MTLRRSKASTLPCMSATQNRIMRQNRPRTEAHASSKMCDVTPMVWCVVLSAGLSALNASEMTALVREASNWAFRLDLQERTRHPCLSPSPAAPDAEPINF
eukprot:2366556-Rhodomonas_salina.1